MNHRLAREKILSSLPFLSQTSQTYRERPVLRRGCFEKNFPPTFGTIAQKIIRTEETMGIHAYE
jgi:hypothetical protein